MFENRIELKLDTWVMIALAIIVFALLVVQYGDKNATVAPSVVIEGQEYALTEMAEEQMTETVYLLNKDGVPVMWNVYLSQVGDSNILTGVTYYPEQLVLIASYGSDGEMLQEQVMGKNKYPNVPAEDPTVISNPTFGRYEELEINAWAMEYSLPEGTETIKMYSNG